LMMMMMTTTTTTTMKVMMCRSVGFEKLLQKMEKLQPQSLGYYVLKQCKSCFHEVPKIVRS
jgi:hypothetical protein